MPFARVFVSQSLSDSQLAAISDAIHDSMVSVFKVPAADRFHLITRHSPQELLYTPEYMGVQHGEQIAILQITVSEGRSIETKKALFAALAAAIEKTGAISGADVIVTLIEIKKENWSFGNGIAHYAT